MPSCLGGLRAVAAAAATLAAAWTPDRFVISSWVDPIVNASAFPAEYARMRAANFTVLLGGFGAVDPVAVKAQVAACASAGLACIPTSCESPTGPGPSGTCVGVAAPVWGYQLADEPQESAFPALATWMASVAARAPGALRFVNLLPNYGFPPPSSAVYEAYVDAFVAQVRPDMLCFDHYPLFTDADPADDTSPAGYLRNLAVVSAKATAAGLPFMNFFGAMPYNGRPNESEAHMRWQAYASLAYGARGVLYFCYWSPTGASFLWGGAMMVPRSLGGAAPVYQPGPKLAQAARINAKLEAFGTFLLPAAHAGVFLANGTGADTVAVPTGAGGGGVATVGGSGAGPTWSVLIGAYASPGPAWASAVLVQNQDWAFPAVLSCGFAPNTTAWELDPATGTVSPAWDDAPALPGFQLYVDAGDARLLVFPGAAL